MPEASGIETRPIEAKIPPESRFALGDISEKLKILIDYRHRSQNWRNERSGLEGIPDHDPFKSISQGMEKALLQYINETKHKLKKDLAPDEIPALLELIDSYLELTENDDLKTRLGQLKTELSAE